MFGKCRSSEFENFKYLINERSLSLSVWFIELLISIMWLKKVWGTEALKSLTDSMHRHFVAYMSCKSCVMMMSAKTSIEDISNLNLATF